MDNKPSDNEDVKGFNDSELEDIMNEIENLEKEFVEPSKEPEKFKADAPANTSETNPPIAASHEHNIVRLAPPANSHPEHHTSMNLQVEGQLGVVMSFKIGKQVVTFKVEDSGLTIEMQNGAKFTIPLEDVKKSA